MSYVSKIVREYAGSDPAMTEIRKNYEAIEDFKIEAGEKGFSREYIQRVLGEMKQGLIESHESYRKNKIAEMKKKTAAVENEYKKKMVDSDSARTSLQKWQNGFSAMSDTEIEKIADDFLLMKHDPEIHELQALSQTLRERKSLKFDSVRNAVNQRGFSRPWELMAPETYRDLKEIEGLGYGEFLNVVTGTGMDGKQKRVPQVLSFDDLFEE